MNIKSRTILPFIILVFTLSCSTGSSSRKEEYTRKQKVLREIKYGRLLANKILAKYRLYDNESINRYVNMVGKSVAMFSGRSEIEYYFAVLDSNDINAYATPGGYVFITRGALARMKNEAELAGVLAHEIGHINNFHIMKDLPPPRETGGFVNVLASLLVAQGAVVSSAFSEVINKAADLLFEKGYRIEDEYEADRTAVIYVSETGYYPPGLVDFINRIWQVKKGEGGQVVYNTHPPFEERISRLQSFIESGSYDRGRPRVTKRFALAMKALK